MVYSGVKNQSTINGQIYNKNQKPGNVQFGTTLTIHAHEALDMSEADRNNEKLTEEVQYHVHLTLFSIQ